MTLTAAALNGFFSSFGLPAYARLNVPDGAPMPYITYDVLYPGPMNGDVMHAWLWYRGSGYTDIMAKVDQIRAAIDGSASIRTPGGAVYLFIDPSTPFAQEQPDPDVNVRAMMLTMILRTNTL